MPTQPCIPTSGPAGQLIAAHPVLSLIVLLAYALIVAGLSFLAGWRICARRRDAQAAQFRAAWRNHSGMPDHHRS